MKTSIDRILTTHVGSLPRPETLFEPLIAENNGTPFDAVSLQAGVREAVAKSVQMQADCGLDVVGDGETGKASYTHYVQHRLSGVERTKAGRPAALPQVPLDLREHPDLVAIQSSGRGTARSLLGELACEGPISYANTAPLRRDVDNLVAAAKISSPAELFLTSASPGTLAFFVQDHHYGNEDRFVAALAEAMRTEYEEIHRAGFVLHIDCPDLAMSWHIRHANMTENEFLRRVARNVEALNHATRNIPADAMRLHICWGNYPGPHTHDIAVSKIIDAVAQARPQGIMFEGANPRHEHEWEDWGRAAIPDDKILFPGLIDTTTNLVEHERLVAQRIHRYATIVGRQRVIASTDCGFGTVAGRDVVAPSVVWAKLRALSRGASIASTTLWASRTKSPSELAN